MPVSIHKKKQELPFVVISPANKRNSGMIGSPINRNLLSNGKSIFRPKQTKE
ncbi:hypothetical protein Xedl_00520 [Xenorhabdus eapokensis]|uniref:Uncharacterized protein n=1 Tax=Xenorhabdus eapokensis TaxID=1873482 RepID=A0A1Q5TYJ8_9GAMM|nr:hypothetical protein Xedl_00660 [Xenorhabdus eapokensis]OKP05293.1 hypothetical protein Xedl_00520 [Xenorhabdus eapokensis]